VNGTLTSLNTQIRNARSAKPVIDTARPLDTLFEVEPLGGGEGEPALTVFLAGSECPYACVFCDLWKHTTDAPTPVGAIPSQIRYGLDTVPPAVDPASLRIKLYNASNFFEPRAVPADDDAEILDLLAPFPAVTVENHPRLTNERCLAFGAALDGRLEVAVGLETIAPDTLSRLNKRATLDDFDRAADTLISRDIDVRAFVLLAPPFQAIGEAVEWAVRSVQHALERGARFVAINPVRAGNGFMDELKAAGEWTPPTLAQVEAALGQALELGGGIVVADLWEIQRFGSCPECESLRISNLETMNRTQVPARITHCERCDT
jgi:archaeosine synthase beta-subunit